MTWGLFLFGVGAGFLLDSSVFSVSRGCGLVAAVLVCVFCVEFVCLVVGLVVFFRFRWVHGIALVLGFCFFFFSFSFLLFFLCLFFSFFFIFLFLVFFLLSPFL